MIIATVKANARTIIRRHHNRLVVFRFGKVFSRENMGQSRYDDARFISVLAAYLLEPRTRCVRVWG